MVRASSCCWGAWNSRVILLCRHCWRQHRSVPESGKEVRRRGPPHRKWPRSRHLGSEFDSRKTSEGLRSGSRPTWNRRSSPSYRQVPQRFSRKVRSADIAVQSQIPPIFSFVSQLHHEVILIARACRTLAEYPRERLIPQHRSFGDSTPTTLKGLSPVKYRAQTLTA